jgi:hypothetical protein
MKSQYYFFILLSGMSKNSNHFLNVFLWRKSSDKNGKNCHKMENFLLEQSLARACSSKTIYSTILTTISDLISNSEPYFGPKLL